MSEVKSLALLVTPRVAQSLFHPETYITKSGAVGASVKPQGAWASISVETALLILQNLEAFEAQCCLAASNAKRPGELKRLMDLRTSKEEAKAVKASPKAKPTRKEELGGELAGIMG